MLQRTTLQRILFIGLLILLSISQTGIVLAGTNVWTNTGPTISGSIMALAIDSVTPGTLYAGTNDGVFKSTDSGRSWNAVNNGLPTNAFVYALAIDPVTPTTLYAGTRGGYDGEYGGVYKSTNGGATWIAFSTGLP